MQNFALYSQILSALPDDLMKAIGEGAKYRKGKTADGSISYRYSWKDLEVTCNLMPREQIDKHLRGFAGYVHYIYQGQPDSRGRKIIQRISSTKLVVAVVVEPDIDDQGRVNDLLANLSDELQPIIFFHDALFDQNLALLLAPDASFDEASEIDPPPFELGGRVPGEYPTPATLPQSPTLERRELGKFSAHQVTHLSQRAELAIRGGNYGAGISLYQETLTILRRELGNNHRDVVTCLNRLIGLYEKEGNYQSALPLVQQLLARHRTILDGTDPQLLLTLDHLAWLYREVGNYEGALPLLQEALSLRRQKWGNNHPDVAESLNNLAMFYSDTGRHSEGLLLIEEALSIQQRNFGHDHPQTATYLHNQAGLYDDLGDYRSALPGYQEALSIRRQVLGNNHPLVALTLTGLAGCYKSIGNYQLALPLYQEALDIRYQALGNDHLDVARSLNNLAELYSVMGQYHKALPLFKQALVIRQAKLGENHPDIAMSLQSLGELQLKMGSYQNALAHLQQALAVTIQVFGDQHPMVAQSMNALAALYDARGDFKQSLPVFQEVLGILRHAYGDRHPDVLISLCNLAGAYSKMGQYEEARRLYQQVLAIAQEKQGEWQPLVANIMINVAAFYSSTGHYKEAIRLYGEAIPILREGLWNLLDTAIGLNALASLYMEIGDNENAWRLFQEALDINRQALGDHHPRVAINLDNLAALAQTMGDFKQALAIHQEALAIFRQAYGETHPDVATTLYNMASCYHVNRDYEQALPLYQQALAIRQELFGAIHPDVAQLLLYLAMLYHDMGAYDEALPLYQQALSSAREAFGNVHPEVAETLMRLGSLYAATQRESSALAPFQEADTIQLEFIGTIFSLGSERQRTAYVQKLRIDFDILLSFFLQMFQRDQQKAGQLAFNITLQRKGLGIEALAIQRDAVLQGHYPQLMTELNEVASIRKRIGEAMIAGPGQEDPEIYKRRLADLTREKEKLEAELAQQIPEMNLTSQLRSANASFVAQCLPPDAALIEFVQFDPLDFQITARDKPWWQPARYIAFVLVADEPDQVQLIDLGPAGPIDHMIAAFRLTVTGDARALTTEPEEIEQAEDTTPARELRAMVFDPLLKSLGNRSRLFIAPDGELSQLPFEALPLDGDLRLIDLYQISYLTTGRELLRFINKPNLLPKGPAVFADPDFDLVTENIAPLPSEEQSIGHQSRDLDRSGLHFDRLKGAWQEGEQIGVQLGVKPLLAEAALEGTLKRLGSPRILHLATHGFFLSDQPTDLNIAFSNLEMISSPKERMGSRLFGQRLEDPLLRSGLALAGANSWLDGKTLRPDAEDGLLTAEDVTGLDLLNTELVVLSACDTGRGDVHVGEGVFGLRRAFVLAGAKTLVMSLWKVPDQATQELMVDFYQRLLKGMPRAEALHKAQLAIKKKYRHPRFWGAFICQGDPGPLLEINPNSQPRH